MARLTARQRAYLKRELEASIRAQVSWMNLCGGNAAGYLLKYGSKHDPEHHGDGGEAIYAADAEALRRMRDELNSLTA